MWDTWVTEPSLQKRAVKVRGGLWVQILCKRCNNEVCSMYAEAYVEFVRHLLNSPRITDAGGVARLVRIPVDRLHVAKQLVAMILAIESIAFCRHNGEMRRFVLDPNGTLEPRFRFHGFLVPNKASAGTIATYHARVDTYAKGYGFTGGEISYPPFGFIYSSSIGPGYDIQRLTDITEWFTEGSSRTRTNANVALHARETGVDSMHVVFGSERIRPTVDHIGGRFVR